MRALQFPDTSLQVIKQEGQFQCYNEGASVNLDFEIEQARPVAEALVFQHDPLPSPSFPEIQSALYHYGTLLAGRAGVAPTTIPRSNMIAYFTNPDPATGLKIANVDPTVFDKIYIGHGQGSTPPGSQDGFVTFFFSDFPNFTGVIP